jgi:uncharacterized damage-inducible protein DinB
MDKLFEEYLSILQQSHDDILKMIADLPPEALDWVPGPETNSISVLIFHLTGSERYWIGDVVMGEDSKRDREAEFRVRGVDMAALKQRLDGSLAYARSAMERLKIEDLDRTRTAANWGRTVSVAFALLHCLTHAREHVGHIELTGQLWRQANAAK